MLITVVTSRVNKHFVLEGFTVSGFHLSTLPSSLRSSLYRYQWIHVPCSFTDGSGQNRR